MQPPAPTWGGVLSSDLDYLSQAPWAPFIPGALIAVTVGALNALADAFRDRIGPGTLLAARPGHQDPLHPRRFRSGGRRCPANRRLTRYSASRTCTSPCTTGPPPRSAASPCAVRAGEIVGLVGESGSGKTLTCRAALGVLPPGCAVARGTISFGGEDVTDLSRRGLGAAARHRHRRGVPGPRLVPEPEPDRRQPAGRGAAGEAAAVARARRAARRSSCSPPSACTSPERVFHQIPAELSGGMLQRVMIAIAISCDPRLLIADEATTALDVTIQAEIIELLRDLRDQRSLAVLFVSHDLAVIRELCDRVVVFYAGEVGRDRPGRGDHRPAAAPLHPGAAPGRLGRRLPAPRAAGDPRPAAADGRADRRLPVRRALPGRHRRVPVGPVDLLRLGPGHQARCVRADDPELARRRRGRAGRPMTARHRPTPRRHRPDAAAAARAGGVDVVLGRGWRANHVLSEVDLKIWPGEIVGLVGETGSGKTTLARTVVGLIRPRKGRVPSTAPRSPACAGRPPSRAAQRPRPARLPGPAALARPGPDRRADRRRGPADPRRPRRGGDRGARSRALAKVGLDATLLRRTPGQISGGQRQRVSIARALAVDPELLFCDEPVSALDASNRNYILRLLGDLRDSLGLPIVIISHDLSSLAGIADRVVVLYRGRIVEDGPVAQVFTAPRHPYTALLMASAPSVKHDRPLTVHQLRRTAADPDARRRRRARACSPPAARSRSTPAPSSRPSSRWPRPGPTAGARPATGATSGRRSPGRGPPWPPRASAQHHARSQSAHALPEGICFMPVEFIGMIATKDGSETRLGRGPIIDKDFTRRFVRAHEDAGFDRVLIGYASSHPDGTQVAAYAAAHSERLGFLVAHRPGFVAPTLAARQFTTLDQFSDGRIAVHIITGGHDAEQRRDGDYLSKDERYARTDEYLDIAQAGLDVRPAVQLPRHVLPGRGPPVRRQVGPGAGIRLYFGGSSEAAYRVGGKHADTYALWGEPLAETKQQIDSVNAAAKDAGPRRRPRHLRQLPPHPRPDRGTRLGARAPHPGGHQGERRRLPRPVGRRSPSASAATTRRTSARSGCWPPPPRASCTTGRCGPRSPPRPAPAATRPRWSARRKRSPRRSSTTSTSASPPSSSGATTPTTTPSTTAATCSRWSARRSPGATPSRPPRDAAAASRAAAAVHGVSDRKRQLKLGAVSHGVGRPRLALPVAGRGLPGRRQRQRQLVHRAGPPGRGGQVRPDLHRRQPVHHRRLAAALPQPARADDAAVRPRGHAPSTSAWSPP